MDEIVYCTSCGKPNRSTNNFCEYCGKPISLVLHDSAAKPQAAPQSTPQSAANRYSASHQTAEQKHSENKKAFLWLAIVVGIVVLVGALLIAVLPKKAIDFPSLSDLIPSETATPQPVDIEPPRQKLTMEGDWGWEFESGVLTISGSGPMTDYSWDYRPWENLEQHVQQIYVMDGITSIGDYAFKNCQNALEVRLPEGITSIGTSAFEYCAALPEISLPSTVERIGTEAFCLCVELHSIEIPAAVKELPGDAFFASGLQEIRVQPGNEAYIAKDNVLYTIDEKTLVFYPDDPDRTEYSIPEGVETIGDYAFTQSNHLINVDIPVSVTRIGTTAFRFMRGLRTITYAGSRFQWSRIEIGEFNESFNEVDIEFKG